MQCAAQQIGDLLVVRPMGRETAQVAAMMRETCAQSDPVGVVAAAAARRFSAVSYMPATAMLGEVLWPQQKCSMYRGIFQNYENSRVIRLAERRPSGRQ